MRARDLGITVGHLPPGPHNAITDVPGVRVGHTTLIRGTSVRTGVTAILPHGGNTFREKVPASAFTLNGNGEVMGLSWLLEQGALESPILLTNTLNVGLVADAAVTWMLRTVPEAGRTDDTPLPVVAECDDGVLNDIQGRHVQAEDVWAALDGASDGPVEEGAVGAGTGMTAYELKSGIGTASRVVNGYTVGVLVNDNHGRRPQLCIQGVPVGRRLKVDMPSWYTEGSIVMVVATDAPLLDRALRRLAMRACLGLARIGTMAHHGSGEFVIAFSVAHRIPHTAPPGGHMTFSLLHDTALDPLFIAAGEACEEAVLNALLAAPDMVGRDGHSIKRLPPDALLELLS